VTPRTCTLKVSNNLSFADALRGRVGEPKSSILKGPRCRDCGSWDVYAAVIGEHSGSVQASLSRGCRKQLWEIKRGLAVLRCSADTRARMGLGRISRTVGPTELI